MQETVLSIPNISCGHCVMAIKKELSRIKGIKEIEGDPKNKHIRVKWEAPATLEGIKETLIDINYPAA